MAKNTATKAASGIDALSNRLTDDLVTLDKELSEIDLLIAQAKNEAGRHEGKRSIAADKFETLTGSSADVTNRLEQATTLIALTQRAALMETQVEVLEGKRRTLARYRDSLADYVAALAAVDPSSIAPGSDDLATDVPMPANVARVLMAAQEDLRREISRAMHDGPAQSLTNIVLQAQIVERLVATDPAASAKEVGQLVAMVQQTLDATKSFIFDVRPMVLDDLGLVPTLRRATRERSDRAGIPVEFESMGQDRRLPMDLESALFRMLDEGLAGYLSAAPDHIALRLDWGDRLTADMVATRAIVEPTKASDVEIPTQEAGKSLPPALAALVEERREAERDAAEAAVRDSIVVLPAQPWREIQDRAASVGVEAELRADGGHLHVATDLPILDGAAARKP
jgi:two-component system, NarL family, sensor histidine kinase DegS